jgi:hypothetical protein
VLGRGDPVQVPGEEAFSETVVFELQDRAGAERLCERLRPRWHVGIHGDDLAAAVAVELRPQEGDLAVLLRAVKLWAGDSALDAIGYHVDGRGHVLESGTAAWRTAA